MQNSCCFKRICGLGTLKRKELEKTLPPMRDETPGVPMERSIPLTGYLFLEVFLICSFCQSSD